MEDKCMKRDQKNSPKRLPPVSIPLSFDKAIEGLLQVDPKGPVPEKLAKKKPRPQK
jgi:hypothetical protein